MSSFVRLAALESRAASHSLWTSGTKRKRGHWICADCKAGRAQRQRRAFGDGGRFPTKQAISTYSPIGLYDGEEIGTEQQGRSQKGNVQERKSQHQKQGFRTWELESSWENSERTEDDLEHHITAPSVRTRRARMQRVDSTLLNIDYVSALPQALANNQPDMIARCLAAAGEANDLNFIQNIPRTTFAECIRLLQPCNFTKPLTTTYSEISSVIARNLGLPPVRQIAWQHMRILRNIFVTRRNAGVGLGLPEYKMLLRAAQDLGMRSMAVHLCTLLVQEGHVPDTDCYNYMMSAAVWNDFHQPLSRHTVRVTRFYQERRSQRGFRGQPYLNYKVGQGGLKRRVTRIFSEMLEHGAVADEKSFRNVILAAAREGDLPLVKSILRKVWEVDVDALMAGKSDLTISQVPNERDWKLQPTSGLLFALAHAFGINNDIPSALRIVDYFARRYHIDIDRETWSQLLEYTFVLAVKRSGARSKALGAEEGKLPIQSVLSLWETMTAPPYSVQPTMGMYNHLIRNLQQRDSPTKMYDKMCEGWQISHNSRQKSYLAWYALTKALENGEEHPHPTSLEELRRNWEHLDLVKMRNLFWLKRWSRLFLSTLTSVNFIDVSMDWALRRIPRFLWDWRHFAPTLVRYDTVGGMVEFRIRTEEDVEREQDAAALLEQKESLVREKIPLFVQDPWPKRESPWDSHKRVRSTAESVEVAKTAHSK